jgi:tight adherence protein B
VNRLPWAGGIVLPAALREVNAGAIVIAIGAGATVVLLLLWLSHLARRPRARVHERVAALRERTPYAAAPVEMLRDRRASSVRVLDLALRGRSWTQAQRLALERAGLELRVAEYVALRLLVVAAGAVVGGLLGVRGGFVLPAALAGGVAGVLAPAIWMRRRVAHRRRAIDTELGELCEMMASMLQSGFGYLQALAMAAEQLQPPLSTELAQMRDAIRLGAGVDEALEQLNARLDSADFDMVATAIAIQRRSGGSLAGILRNVAQTIRERQLFKLEIAALTSRERFSALIVAGFPLLLVAGLTAMMPATFGRLFTDPAGRAILAIALTADTVGYLVIKRVTKLEV